VASLTELARIHTPLEGPELAHLQRLVASWGPLADLSFADLLLFAPVSRQGGGEVRQFVVLGQLRPTTNQTIYRHDFVGQLIDESERPLVARAFRLGETIEGEINVAALQTRVRVLAIPVRWRGQVVAVATREAAPTMGRHPGELEQIYMQVFRRFASMIASGTFPFAAEDTETEEAPRVGDGVILLGPDTVVEYASPNAVSALHRIGVHANAEGSRLGELGFEEAGIRTAYAIGVPVTEEVERGPEVTLLVRCIPLMDDDKVSGALVLMRDISELRRRDRMLISMDATIREIHHRVKNNLQTISSLLRLQGRRVASTEAKDAIEESVRRIRAIALVHETLSREAGDDVSFGEIVRPLVRMVEEGLLSPDRPVRFRLEGDPGQLPARVATPLAVVLTELLQNAVDHAFGHGDGDDPVDGRLEGNVTVSMDNDGEELTIRVVDDGVGVPDGFRLDQTSGLGLSIVRTLVTSELNGTISMAPGRADGDRPGTVVELRVPSSLVETRER
jgi:two-component system, sensor histidine kinase PdtaS